MSQSSAMNGNDVNTTGNGMHPNGDENGNVMDDANSSDSLNDHDCTERGLDRNQLVRIIVQAIDSLGYSDSARTLEKEASVEAMSLQMRRLRDCVLLGRWDQLEHVLSEVTVFKSESDARAARFVLYEQKFLELLEAGQTAQALECLRNDLTRLSRDPNLLHKLPLLCMCTTPDEVREHARWPGAGSESRASVLQKLQSYVPSNELLQENRLENMLCQAILYQKQIAMFPYTKQREASLLEDMVHCEDLLPRKILHKLEGHSDEVWFVQFSHDGEYLSSASKDGSAIIWKSRALLAGECETSNAMLHKLEGHSLTICFLSWSPTDKYLLSCGEDHTLRLWDVKSGRCVRVFDRHVGQITACAWMPHGRSFVSGAHDSTIYEWNVDSGECIASYAATARVNDVSISKDGKLLIATCSDNGIQIFDTTAKTQIAAMKEKVSITSIFLSSDSESLLVNTNSSEDPKMQEPEIHIWSMRDMEIRQKFKGFKQTKYVIRGCFGGHQQMLVLCGSEDHMVYIWERKSRELIAKLEGHQGTVNTVACSEADGNLIASGSDDKTVIVGSNRCMAA